MEFKFLYLVIIGIVFLVNMYRKFKAQQREAEKKHPAPPRRSLPNEPPQPTSEQPKFETLEDILRRAAEESRKQREEARRQREEQKRKIQPQRTWVTERPKPAPRKQTSPFLTQDNPNYRDPRMEAITTMEGDSLEAYSVEASSLETIGEEGGVSISDVHKQVETFVVEEQAPSINLRQAMLHQVVLQRPDY